MIYRNLTLCILVAGLMTLIAAPQSAQAGIDDGSPATAMFYSDGSGYCSGTLNGFLGSSDSGAYLVLEEYSGGNSTGGYIMCQYNGQYKYAPLDYTDSALNAAFQKIVAMPHEVHVYVHWNTSGYVDAIQVFNASFYH